MNNDRLLIGWKEIAEVLGQHPNLVQRKHGMELQRLGVVHKVRKRLEGGHHSYVVRAWESHIKYWVVTKTQKGEKI